MPTALPVTLTMRGNGQKLISGAEFIVTTLKFFYIDVEAEARLLQFIGFHREQVLSIRIALMSKVPTANLL